MYIIIFIYDTLKIFSDHSGKVIGNHISVQSPTLGNGFYAYIDGRMLVTSNNYICHSTIQYSLFQVNKIYRDNRDNFFPYWNKLYKDCTIIFIYLHYLYIYGLFINFSEIFMDGLACV